jgi:hypothetical protein
MTYLLPPIYSALASQSLMLAFCDPTPLINRQSGIILVHFWCPIACKAGLSIAAATPDPSATNDINFSDDAGITQKFWWNHRMQSAVTQQARVDTFLISQHSLPFFDDYCKRDPDDAGKSVITYQHYGRNGTN